MVTGIQTVRQGSSAAVDIMTAVMGSTRIPDPAQVAVASQASLSQFWA